MSTFGVTYQCKDGINNKFSTQTIISGKYLELYSGIVYMLTIFYVIKLSYEEHVWSCILI